MSHASGEEPPGVPTWVKVVGAITLALLLLFAAMSLFGGGEHGPGRHAPVGDEENTGAGSSQACRAQPFEHGGGSGAEVVCQDAEGPGQTAQGFRCENPGHGGIEGQWDLDAGEVTVTARDASGATVFSGTYAGQGSDSASFPEGEPGSWELEAMRGDGFAGGFTVQTFCSN